MAMAHGYVGEWIYTVDGWMAGREGGMDGWTDGWMERMSEGRRGCRGDTVGGWTKAMLEKINVKVRCL